MSVPKIHFMRAAPALCLALAGCHSDAPPAGEGSAKAGDRILRELAALKPTNAADPLPPGYHRFTFDDGSWYVATGIDSHKESDGGTVGVLTSAGEMAIFFTHVCGSGKMPVSFPGDSANAVLAGLKATTKQYQP